jgi:predicted RNA-binding Zn-ribbon protein involved in translation (DUF1610 family)
MLLFYPDQEVTKPLLCADCGANTDILASQLNGRVFLSTLLERHFFVCPDCGRLSIKFAVRPK